MTSRIRFTVETVENRGKTVWLAGVNREETVHGSFTGRSNTMAALLQTVARLRIAIPTSTERL